MFSRHLVVFSCERARRIALTDSSLDSIYSLYLYKDISAPTYYAEVGVV